MRDPVYDDWFPANDLQRKIFKFIDKKVIKQASKIVFTSPGTLNLYKSRYFQENENKWVLIRNGYDEKNFVDADRYRCSNIEVADSSIVTLLHSGIIYPDDRDPRALFEALSKLKQQLFFSKDKFRLILRATGHDQLIADLINKNDLNDIVCIKPSISYHHALAEMMDVDGLIVMQGNSCNHQTPTKVYEYLRAEKPILLLADRSSDSHQVLKEVGRDSSVADLDNVEMIEKVLIGYIENINHPMFKEKYTQFSRQEQTKQLADLLDHLILCELTRS